jgi:anti-anti-sigma factor
MPRPYRHLEVESADQVFCVRLRKPQLDEADLYELCNELTRLFTEDGCRKMVLSLGPEEPQLLYSVFLAKLVTLRRRLEADGGALKLCEVGPGTMEIFDACGLRPLFEFYPDQAAALRSFAG